LVGARFSPVVTAVPVVLTEPLVKVRLSRFPVAAAATAKDESARVLILPVVVVEVIEVVPKPVSAIEPEVAVKDKAPVVRVKPLEAVRRPAEVIVPEPEVEIFPDVVTLSPAVDGERVVPDLDQ
jgi:hypothetical protein